MSTPDRDREHIQHRLNFYHWCCMNRPEIVREWLRAIGKLPEAEPKKTVFREIIHTGSAHIESNEEIGPPIIAGEDEPDPIIETGLPPLDLGPLPNGPAISKVTEEPLEAELEDEKK